MNNLDNYCPVELLIQMLSKKYMISVLRDLYNGKSHFNEILENNPRIENKSLSRCLKYMQENGLIEKKVDYNDKLETEYFLTEKSKNLDKILYELVDYTLKSDIEITDSQKEELLEEIENRFKIS